MDLGSGLTFGTHSVNGKVTTGIFFGNKAKKATPQLPIRSTVHPDDDGTMTIESTVKHPQGKSFKSREKQKVERALSATSEGSNKSMKTEKKSRLSKKTIQSKGDGKATKKSTEPEEVEDQVVNTKYVTLTQGQLTTILSLVKNHANEVDITDVLEEKGPNDESSKKSVDVDESENGVKSEIRSNENKVQKQSSKSEDEMKENLVEKTETDPEKDAESVNYPKKDDSANKKSSFFLGQALPRDGATSAKKRENQQRWREELEKQRDEQRKRKQNERSDRLRYEDDELWTKHFDTMLPTKGSPRPSDSVMGNTAGDIKVSQSDANLKNPTSGSGAPTLKQTAEAEYQNNLRNSIDNSEIGDFASIMTNTALPQRSTFLRTMTSLLDPAQIEALEVKRKKQEEHRKAIEAQVAERKRKKEEEDERRRQLEAEEDRRLAAERDFISQRAEIEKARQQMQETKREQQTKELYQQMKNAEESALRDKLARREQLLRTKGHDTSRLERTHQMTLEMSHKIEQPPLPHRDQNLVVRMSTESGQARAPFAVTAHTDQDPIKFELLLNQRHDGQLVESGVQTDSTFRIGSDSDTETEYLRLPQKSKSSEKPTKVRNLENNPNRQYDKRSRLATKQKRNQPRPKWGVGQKNLTFVPASQRYTAGQQKYDPTMRRREGTRRIEEDASVEKQKKDFDSDRRLRETQFQEKSKFSSPQKLVGTQRPKSPAGRTRQKELVHRHINKVGGAQRPSSGIHATTDKAKYRSDRHTNESPVPQTNDFVEYRRTSAVLDPSLPQSRPETGLVASTSDLIQGYKTNEGDPLFNPDIVRQHERQDQILREISILRQGLLLKQREVAGYPGMNHNFQPLAGAVSPTNLILAGGGNLPERTNDTP